VGRQRGAVRGPTVRAREAGDLMRSFPAGLMRMWPISTRVNKPENDDPLRLGGRGRR
jgi:putative SOS response-associated peptidase YedK